MSSIKIELKPFTVPNFVIGADKTSSRQNDWTESSLYPLSEVDEEPLNDMFNEFKDAVFKKRD